MSVTEADLSALAESRDIISMGMMADEVRRRLHGRQTTFVRVARIPAEPGAPITVPEGAGEARITGAPASQALAVQRVREVDAIAGTVPLSAYSLADLEQLAGREGIRLRTVLEELRAAGLELIAEAPLDRLGDAHRSIEDVNIAGLTLARLTVETSPADPIPLFKQVAALQQDVGILRAFAPLARRANPAAPSTGYDDVRRVALARLFVGNVSSIQVDWALYGPKLAQVALTMGADDVDGVSPVDDQSLGPRRSPIAEIRRNIAAAGLEPVERDGRFDRLT